VVEVVLDVVVAGSVDEVVLPVELTVDDVVV
jgi:hypothetical protein